MIIEYLKELKNDGIRYFLTEGKIPKVRKNSQLQDYGSGESLNREQFLGFLMNTFLKEPGKTSGEMDLDLGISLSLEEVQINLGFDQGNKLSR